MECIKKYFKGNMSRIICVYGPHINSIPTQSARRIWETFQKQYSNFDNFMKFTVHVHFFNLQVLFCKTLNKWPCTEVSWNYRNLSTVLETFLKFTLHFEWEIVVKLTCVTRDINPLRLVLNVIRLTKLIRGLCRNRLNLQNWPKINWIKKNAIINNEFSSFVIIHGSFALKI